MGTDFIIAVNIIPDVAERADGLKKEPTAAPRESNIIKVLMQSIHIATYSLVRASLEDADIVIEPQLVHSNAADLLRAQESITAIRSRLKTRN